MRFLLRSHLSATFEIDEATNGQDGLTLLDHNNYSLILLDIMMEEMDGWEVCKKIRGKGWNIPIIMLTARSDVKDKVQGLNLGADDYIVKPFDPEELIARMNALLRRSEQANQEREGLIRVNGLILDSHSREAFVDDKEVILTNKEFDLMLLLASNPNWAYTRDMLLDEIWGEYKILDTRTVDSHIKHVRSKFKKAGLPFNPIKTVWGVGYKFNLPDEKK